jgi:thiol-disulfide isomerase/thioredoxin
VISRRDGLVALGAWAALAAKGARAQPSPGHQISDWPRATPTPAFETLNLQGQALRLADFKGRAVLLNFWASWCEPCRAEMPTLTALPEVYGPERLAVIALNFKEAPQRVAQFVASTAFSAPVGLDPQGAIARAWGVKIFPSTLLIDRQGRARQRVVGEVDWTSAPALAWVDRLLAA